MIAEELNPQSAVIHHKLPEQQRSSEVHAVLQKLRHILISRRKSTSGVAPFAGVSSYWENRYAAGGTSGAGSAGRLADFKARVLNDFVEQHDIKRVIEFGCGDGSQLALARYPQYVGVDVSPTAIELCRSRFAGNPDMRFFHASERPRFRARYDLVLSLDVILHLVDDRIYQEYMEDLRGHASKYIIVYSSNFDDDGGSARAPHVRHRRFSPFFDSLADEWRLAEVIKNPHSFDPDDQQNTSRADFYIYANITESMPEAEI